MISTKVENFGINKYLLSPLSRIHKRRSEKKMWEMLLIPRGVMSHDVYFVDNSLWSFGRPFVLLFINDRVVRSTKSSTLHEALQLKWLASSKLCVQSMGSRDTPVEIEIMKGITITRTL
jgi:hypothetical protein